MRTSIWCCVVCSLLVSSLHAAEWGMKTGNPEFKSAGPLAFGNDGVLFVGDTKAAAVVAIDTGDKAGEPNEVDLHVHGVDKKIAEACGGSKVMIQDLAVNPKSGVGYMSVSVDGKPGLVKLLTDGNVEAISLDKVDYSKVTLPNPPEDKPVGRRNRNLSRSIDHRHRIQRR